MLPDAALVRLARKIPEPKSFFRGVGLEPAANLPANIIAFCRHREGELSPEREKRTQHHRSMLIVLLEGAGEVCLDARIFSLQAGQALLVHPFQFHSYVLTPGPMCWVFLTFEGAEQAGWEGPKAQRGQDLRAVEWALTEECLRLWMEKGSPLLLQHCLATLLQSLQEHRAAGHRRHHPMTGDRMKILADINRHVIAAIKHPAGLKFLAEKLGRSESNLRKQFRELTGTSLGKHIRNLRIMRACSELHRTGLGVGEVAEACGFDSIYSFSRAFKNTMGMSPGRYRRVFQEKPRRDRQVSRRPGRT